MPIALRTEVPRRVDWLAAVRADWPSSTGHFEPPKAQGRQLRACAPKTNDIRFFCIYLFFRVLYLPYH